MSQRADLRRRADALLDAAAALLIDNGPRQLRIEDVAKRAGVGKGTVYLHWKSREHLLVAVGAREGAAMLDAVIAAVHADPAEGTLSRYLRRHFLETAKRPILARIFVTDDAELAGIAGHPVRVRLAKSKRSTALEHLTALRSARLLRPDLDLEEVDYAVEAIAYGFFAAAPLLADDPRFTVEHRADRLAEVLHRSFEPDRPPAPSRCAKAAPRIIAAFERLADDFRSAAYGPATD